MVFPKIDLVASCQNISHGISKNRSLSENDACCFPCKNPKISMLCMSNSAKRPGLETMKVDIFAIGKGRFRVDLLFSLIVFFFVLVLVVNSSCILCHCVRIFSDHPGSRMCEPRAKLHPGVRIVHLTNLDLTEIAHRIGVTFTPCFSKGSHENASPTNKPI